MDAPRPVGWQRAGVSLDGGPLVEDAHIIWLQVGEHYADSRGFAGTTSYDGTRVRWDHAVGAPGEDAGVLTMAGDLLVEDGVQPDGGPGVMGASALGLRAQRGVAGGDVVVVRVGEHVVHVDGGGDLTHGNSDGVGLTSSRSADERPTQWGAPRVPPQLRVWSERCRRDLAPFHGGTESREAPPPQGIPRDPPLRARRRGARCRRLVRRTAPGCDPATNRARQRCQRHWPPGRPGTAARRET